MRFLTVILISTLLIGIASGTNQLMFARITANITCNHYPSRENVEVLAAGNDEADHDHLAIVVAREGRFDSVVARGNNPIFFIRVHACGQCPPKDSLFVRANKQHSDWLSAVNHPVDLGTFEMGIC